LKPQCMLVFLLCNVHLLYLSLVFSSALVLWPLLFWLVATLSLCFLILAMTSGIS
jgi:hypothetical protein